MKNLICILCFLSLLGCETKTETIYTDVRALSASDLYSGDSVYFYMNYYKDKNKDLALSYEEKAENETNNPEKEVYYLKRSVSLLPKFETYKKLATALQKIHHYEELNRLYWLVNSKHYIDNGTGKREETFLFGQPDKDLVYDQIILNFILYKEITGEDLYWAEEFGIPKDELKEKLLADPRINIDRSTAAYQHLLIQFLPFEKLDSISKTKTHFTYFLSSISDSSNVFSISDKDVSDFNYERFNGLSNSMGLAIEQENITEYYLLEKRENKRGWFKFNFNHYFKPFPGVHAVVYAIDTSATACPREMRHIYHRLTTYSDDTEIIDSKVIAWQSGEELQIANVNNQKLNCQLFKRNWKQPYSKWNFDNQLSSKELVSEHQFYITETGRIESGLPPEVP